MNSLKKLTILCLFFLPYPLSAQLQNPSLEAQRQLFLTAQNALENQDIEGFQASLQKLGDYPLSYYLHYQYLAPRLHMVGTQPLKDFFRAYPNAPLSNSLRYDWLKHLAREARWEQFISDYSPQLKNPDLHCHYVAARLQRGDNDKTLQEEARQLWLNGRSQPKACDAVFDYLYSQQMNDDLLWQRLRLAMLEKNFPLAKFLGKKLSDTGLQRHLALWLQMVSNPLSTLENLTESDSQNVREILLQGLHRLARKDVSNAQRLWQNLKDKYAFSADERDAMQRELVLRVVLSEQPTAWQQLKTLTSQQFDPSLQQLFLQYALQAQDWKAIVDVIQRFSQDTQDQPQWRYWEARALELGGKASIAKDLYKDLAKERDFYGFLAANKVNLPYVFNHQKTPLPDTDVQELYKKHPGLARAQEFFALGMVLEAQREWQAEMAYLNQAEMIQAAALARQWNWYDRAIFTAAKAEYYDDLDMRFPLAFLEQLSVGASEQGVDLAWAYGIMRQESAFRADISSPAGAMGLMQLMPATGRAMADSIGLSLENTQDIYQVETNIRLGTTYLRHMLDRFNGNYTLATAAYNAGPGRAAQWADRYACLPADIWAELIPFRETRTYVQRVLTYAVIFDARLQERGLVEKIRPLRLQAVSGENCVPLTAQN